MSNKNKIKPLFEVAIKINRQPLPPYWEVFLNKLTKEQALSVIETLKYCGEHCIFNYQNKKHNVKLLTLTL
jgi:hypothetical protein